MIRFLGKILISINLVISGDGEIQEVGNPPKFPLIIGGLNDIRGALRVLRESGDLTLCKSEESLRKTVGIQSSKIKPRLSG